MLTPTERIAIYEQALVWLKTHDIYWGLCLILFNLTSSPITEFPELKYTQEDEIMRQNGWPWTEAGRRWRMEVVEQAMKEVKTLIDGPH
jgi:hypothetical protein